MKKKIMVDGHLVQIALDDLIPTPDNNRRAPKKKDKDIAELAESIGSLGQLQPGLARAHPDKEGKYDLRCGARRHMACSVAGLDTMLVIVRELSDQLAVEATVTENLQRVDLSPLEEAQGVKLLRDSGWDLAMIGAHIGKSTKWVQRRARLMTLIPEWVEACQAEKGTAAQWTAGHLEVLARVGPDAQKKLFKGYSAGRQYSVQTIEGLEREVGEHMRTMSAAKWDLEDGTVVKKAGPCKGCDQRASFNPGLFEDDVAETDLKKDRCLNGPCWDKKLKAWLKAREEPLRDKYPKLVRAATTYRAGKNTLSRWEYETVKKGAKGAVPAMDVETGKLMWIKPNSRGKEKAAAPPTVGEKRKELKENRFRYLRSRLACIADPENAGDDQKPKPTDPQPVRPTRNVLIGIMLTDEEMWYGGHGETIPYGKVMEFAGQPDEAIDERLWEIARGTVGSHLENGWQCDAKTVRTIAMILQVPIQDLQKEAKDALPEPAEWVGLKAKDPAPKLKKGKD